MLGEYLAKHNAFCPLCRYNLRGLTGNTCPECGKLLAMTVGLVEPFMAPWICTTVTLCTSAGIGVFFLVMILFFGMPGSGGISSIFYSVTISCFIGCIPLVGSVIWLRRKFMKLHRPVQWNLAGISIVFVSLTFIFFVIAAAMDS